MSPRPTTCAGERRSHVEAGPAEPSDRPGRGYKITERVGDSRATTGLSRGAQRCAAVIGSPHHLRDIPQRAAPCDAHGRRAHRTAVTSRDPSVAVLRCGTPGQELPAGDGSASVDRHRRRPGAPANLTIRLAYQAPYPSTNALQWIGAERRIIRVFRRIPAPADAACSPGGMAHRSRPCSTLSAHTPASETRWRLPLLGRFRQARPGAPRTADISRPASRIGCCGPS